MKFDRYLWWWCGLLLCERPFTTAARHEQAHKMQTDPVAPQHDPSRIQVFHYGKEVLQISSVTPPAAQAEDRYLSMDP
jgi:hypothetical protein